MLYVNSTSFKIYSQYSYNYLYTKTKQLFDKIDSKYIYIPNKKTQ